ncbi:hypothetical protein CPLU01_08044 [Colletotrichum plurivorum]|uniref:Uncharacterized protein n=1 Tax=Colletotrichum plurivorum TaxID=2175906 RepID=A0A8H6NE57_9PEZI|nr:hypothetical protein CPLU01_08044 [Colletotrichum plurivorum]
MGALRLRWPGRQTGALQQHQRTVVLYGVPAPDPTALKRPTAPCGVVRISPSLSGRAKVPFSIRIIIIVDNITNPAATQPAPPSYHQHETSTARGRHSTRHDAVRVALYLAELDIAHHPILSATQSSQSATPTPFFSASWLPRPIPTPNKPDHNRQLHIAILESPGTLWMAGTLRAPDGHFAYPESGAILHLSIHHEEFESLAVARCSSNPSWQLIIHPRTPAPPPHMLPSIHDRSHTTGWAILHVEPCLPHAPTFCIRSVQSIGQGSLSTSFASAMYKPMSVDAVPRCDGGCVVSQVVTRRPLHETTAAAAPEPRCFEPRPASCRPLPCTAPVTLSFDRPPVNEADQHQHN